MHRATIDPKGVLQKNLKTFVYLGAALLVIVAALFSSTGKKTPATAGRGEGPAAAAHASGQHRQQRAGIEEPAQGRARQGAAASGMPLRRARSRARVCDARAAGSRRGLRADWRCCTLRSGPALPASGLRASMAAAQIQLSPEQQQAQLIAAKERARADDARFASNLVYCSLLPNSHSKRNAVPRSMRRRSQRQEDSNLVAAAYRRRTAGRTGQRIQAPDGGQHRFGRGPAISRL